MNTLWAALVVAAGWAQSPPSPGRDPLAGLKSTAQRANRMGTPQMAMGGVRAALEAHPDDDELHAYLGVAHMRAGHYPDALVELALGQNTPYYERDGLQAHANMLRAFGQGRQAAELRLQQLLISDSSGTQINALEGAVYDLRAAGDFEEALAVAERALALMPLSSTSHALMAEVLLDLGEVEEARWHLWLPGMLGYRSVAMDVALARMAVMDGEMVEAEAHMLHAQRLRFRSHAIGARRAELTRLDGRLDEALVTVELERWGWHDVPTLLAVEAKVRWDAGRTAQARSVLERALLLYPQDPDVLEAVDHIRGAY